MDETKRVLWVACGDLSFAHARELFSQLDGREYRLECERNFHQGLEATLRGNYAVSLVDYDLGSRTGIEFLQEAKAHGCRTPIILLAPYHEPKIDTQALRCGATDSLEERDLNAATLARSLRHAIERQRSGERIATREAANAFRTRDDFLDMAAHELKTPLTTLQLQLDSMVHLLSRESKTETVLGRRSVQALRQVHRLNKLVESLLSVARITRGQLALELREFDLRELLSDLVARLAGEAQRAGSLLEVHAAKSAVGFWDRTRLDQMLANLLLNAIKYGGGKPIEVTLSADDELARISVSDHGIGIADEDMARIFNRFEQGRTEYNYPGLGLGLYIAHQIAEAHGGTILVRSSLGRGSNFMVVLPRESRENDETQWEALKRASESRLADDNALLAH